MGHASFQAVSPAGLVIDTVTTEADRILIVAHPATRDAACPDCDLTSGRLHSRYERRLLDLPLHDRSVHFLVKVRRFRCGNRGCQRRIFGESLPDATALRAARRTSRLEVIVHHLGVALGGSTSTGLAPSGRQAVATAPNCGDVCVPSASEVACGS
jgi:transposase